MSDWSTKMETSIKSGSCRAVINSAATHGQDDQNDNGGKNSSQDAPVETLAANKPCDEQAPKKKVQQQLSGSQGNSHLG